MKHNFSCFSCKYKSHFGLVYPQVGYQRWVLWSSSLNLVFLTPEFHSLALPAGFHTGHREWQLMILEFATDRNDSFASLAMIPLPPFLYVFGAVHTQRCSGTNWTQAEQLIKRRRGSIWTRSLNLFPELSLTFVCLGSIILLFSVPVRDLGSTRDAFKASVLPAGGFFSVLFRTWLAFEKKRKWNWRKCLSLFFQDAGVSSCHIWLILSPCYVASAKTQQAFSYPASQGYVCPEAPLFFPTYQWVS